MKQNAIGYLLDKYREGTMTDSELAELEGLAHKDEVLAAASRQARTIQRRRLSVFTTVAVVAVTGVTLMLPRNEEAPLIAQATPPAVAPLPEAPADVAPAAEPIRQSEPLAQAKPLPQRVESVAQRRVESKAEEAATKDPVVMCNNQCEADSVINDIWKFLSV